MRIFVGYLASSLMASAAVHAVDSSESVGPSHLCIDCWPGTSGSCKTPHDVCWHYDVGGACPAGTTECPAVLSTSSVSGVLGVQEAVEAVDGEAAVDGGDSTPDGPEVDTTTPAPVTIGRFSQLRIKRKILDAEKWKVISGHIEINDVVINAQDIDLVCPDPNLCSFYFKGSRSYADWCMNDGSYKVVNLEIGVEDFGAMNPTFHYSRNGIGEAVPRLAKAGVVNGTGAVVSLSTFCTDNLVYDTYEACEVANPVREAEIEITRTEKPDYDTCADFDARPKLAVCGREVTVSDSIEEEANTVAEARNVFEAYQNEGMYAMSGSTNSKKVTSEIGGGRRHVRGLFIKPITCTTNTRHCNKDVAEKVNLGVDWYKEYIYDELLRGTEQFLMPIVGAAGYTPAGAVMSIAKWGCNKWSTHESNAAIKNMCWLLGADDPDKAELDRVQREQVNATYHNTEKILTNLAALEEKLGEGFNQMESKMRDMMAQEVKIEMENYLHRLTSLDVRYRDFADSLRIGNSADQLHYAELFRSSCSEPAFTPADIFRYFYGHACRDCTAMAGGKKSIAYFLDVMTAYASDQTDWKEKGKAFRSGFAIIVMNALYTAQFLHTVCLPEVAQDEDGVAYDRCDDDIWSEHLGQMQKGFTEVVAHLVEEERDNSLNYFKLMKEYTQATPTEVGCLELDRYKGFGNCDTSIQQVWRYTRDQKLESLSDNTKCVGFDEHGTVIFQNCDDVSQRIRWSNSLGGFVDADEEDCTSLSSCNDPQINIQQFFNDIPACFEQQPAMNLSQGKKAEQKDTFKVFNAGYALDGSFSSFTSTQCTNEEPWWEVDLGKEYDVSWIEITGRQYDCDSTCMNRLKDFVVEVRDNEENVVKTIEHADPLGKESKYIDFGTGRLGAVGRYVRIRLKGKDCLELADVKVYGYEKNTNYQCVTDTATHRMSLRIKKFSLTTQCDEKEKGQWWWQSPDGCDFSVEIKEITWGNGQKTSGNPLYKYPTHNDQHNPSWTNNIAWSMNFNTAAGHEEWLTGPIIKFDIKEHGNLNQGNAVNIFANLAAITNPENTDDSLTTGEVSGPWILSGGETDRVLKYKIDYEYRLG